MSYTNKIPVPHDLPLPLPAPHWLLEIILVAAFLLHILFVNLMVGGSIFAIFFEWRGKKNPLYDRLAQEIAKTITVNKSMAVVLGVAPLLIINTLYTVHFYTANALTGLAWILIVPLIITAFILAYFHKYSWQKLSDHKNLHLAIGATSTVIFLAIPLIFLTNINLMLFPERWHDIHGFFSALNLPNVFPRYGHFLAASITITGLFLIGYMKRQAYPFSEIFPGADRSKILRSFFSAPFYATAAQFIIGPLVYVTLPIQGVSWTMNGLLALGIVLALPTLSLMWSELTGKTNYPGQHFLKLVSLLGCTVIAMASARHFYREKALKPHRDAIAQKTLIYQEAVQQALAESQAKSPQKDDLKDQGAVAFGNFCSGCHSYNQRLVGPSIEEIKTIYKDNPKGIIAWVRNPGKKRPDYPQMPTLPVPDRELEEISIHMLNRTE